MDEFNLQKLSVLVVEDNFHMRALVRSILKSLGVEKIEEAADGAQGYEQLRDSAADIVFCDWDMEPMDGIEFVRLVRTGKDSPNPTIPIIMLTGHTEMKRIAQARDAGINEFLAKPISATSLYSRIRSCITKPRLFVSVPGENGFFGPDRRRMQVAGYDGPERRARSPDGEDDGSGDEDQAGSPD